MDLKPKLNRIREICNEYNVAMLGVFGSVSRGEDTLESDVDLLIKFQQSPGLIDFIRLEDKFVEAIGRKVDLTTEDDLHPLVRKNVLNDLKVIYER